MSSRKVPRKKKDKRNENPIIVDRNVSLAFENLEKENKELRAKVTALQQRLVDAEHRCADAREDLAEVTKELSVQISNLSQRIVEECDSTEKWKRKCMIMLPFEKDRKLLLSYLLNNVVERERIVGNVSSVNYDAIVNVMELLSAITDEDNLIDLRPYENKTVARSLVDEAQADENDQAQDERLEALPAAVLSVLQNCLPAAAEQQLLIDHADPIVQQFTILTKFPTVPVFYSILSLLENLKWWPTGSGWQISNLFNSISVKLRGPADRQWRLAAYECLLLGCADFALLPGPAGQKKKPEITPGAAPDRKHLFRTIRAQLGISRQDHVLLTRCILGALCGADLLRNRRSRAKQQRAASSSSRPLKRSQSLDADSFPLLCTECGWGLAKIQQRVPKASLSPRPSGVFKKVLHSPRFTTASSTSPSSTSTSVMSVSEPAEHSYESCNLCELCALREPYHSRAVNFPFTRIQDDVSETLQIGPPVSSVEFRLAMLRSTKPDDLGSAELFFQWRERQLVLIYNAIVAAVISVVERHSREFHDMNDKLADLFSCLCDFRRIVENVSASRQLVPESLFDTFDSVKQHLELLSESGHLPADNLAYPTAPTTEEHTGDDEAAKHRSFWIQHAGSADRVALIAIGRLKGSIALLARCGASNMVDFFDSNEQMRHQAGFRMASRDAARQRYSVSGAGANESLLSPAFWRGRYLHGYPELLSLQLEKQYFYAMINYEGDGEVVMIDSYEDAHALVTRRVSTTLLRHSNPAPYFVSFLLSALSTMPIRAGSSLLSALERVLDLSEKNVIMDRVKQFLLRVLCRETATVIEAIDGEDFDFENFDEPLEENDSCEALRQVLKVFYHVSPEETEITTIDDEIIEYGPFDFDASEADSVLLGVLHEELSHYRLPSREARTAILKNCAQHCLEILRVACGGAISVTRRESKLPLLEKRSSSPTPHALKFDITLKQFAIFCKLMETRISKNSNTFSRRVSLWDETLHCNCRLWFILSYAYHFGRLAEAFVDYRIESLSSDSIAIQHSIVAVDTLLKENVSGSARPASALFADSDDEERVSYDRAVYSSIALIMPDVTSASSKYVQLLQQYVREARVKLGIVARKKDPWKCINLGSKLVHDASVVDLMSAACQLCPTVLRLDLPVDVFQESVHQVVQAAISAFAIYFEEMVKDVSDSRLTELFLPSLLHLSGTSRKEKVLTFLSRRKSHSSSSMVATSSANTTKDDFVIVERHLPTLEQIVIELNSLSWFKKKGLPELIALMMQAASEKRVQCSHILANLDISIGATGTSDECCAVEAGDGESNSSYSSDSEQSGDSQSIETDAWNRLFLPAKRLVNTAEKALGRAFATLAFLSSDDRDDPLVEQNNRNLFLSELYVPSPLESSVTIEKSLLPALDSLLLQVTTMAASTHVTKNVATWLLRIFCSMLRWLVLFGGRSIRPRDVDFVLDELTTVKKVFSAGLEAKAVQAELSPLETLLSVVFETNSETLIEHLQANDMPDGDDTKIVLGEESIHKALGTGFTRLNILCSLFSRQASDKGVASFLQKVSKANNSVHTLSVSGRRKSAPLPESSAWKNSTVLQSLLDDGQPCFTLPPL